MLVLPSKGASIILANERMINDSLMELACTSNDSVRDRLTNILEEIADLRFGEPPYARPAGFYSGPLYFDVFILDPIGNVTDRMNRLKRQVSIRWCDPIKLSNALRTFHCDYAYGCEAMKMDRQAIDELLDIYVAEVQ